MARKPDNRSCPLFAAWLRAVALGTLWPQIAWTRDAFTVVVAVFGCRSDRRPPRR